MPFPFSARAFSFAISEKSLLKAVAGSVGATLWAKEAAQPSAPSAATETTDSVKPAFNLHDANRMISSWLSDFAASEAPYG